MNSKLIKFIATIVTSLVVAGAGYLGLGETGAFGPIIKHHIECAFGHLFDVKIENCSL